MQLMTWPLGRLGSRFSFLFEPSRKRVMHSALGRFMDEPLDLAVGLIEPDGTKRVMPFTVHGKPFYNCEQNARMNSITYRGYCQKSNLRFELNFHSPFYPQNERVCLLPAIYVELRVTWMDHIRWRSEHGERLDKVKLFVQMSRPNTDIEVNEGHIDMSYQVELDPKYVPLDDPDAGELSLLTDEERASRKGRGVAHVVERIHSLNDEAEAYCDEFGKGLILELPVTEFDSGTKWRLVWGAHTGDTILTVKGQPATFRYTRYWSNIDEVIDRAITSRDDTLQISRQFERLLEQSPMYRAHWHLTVLAYQSYLTNTFWCDFEDGKDWFSTFEGTAMFHSTVDVEYNIALLYFAIWPELLKKTLNQWSENTLEHAESGGRVIHHDLGYGLDIGECAYDHSMPVEENTNFILLLHTYAHWTGKFDMIENHANLIRDLANYLIWTDRNDTGFPSEGTANTIADGNEAIQFAREQSYLAIKRVTALESAADILMRAGDLELADKCRNVATEAVRMIEEGAWLGDHYALCMNRDVAGLDDPWSGKPLTLGELKGWDDYSLYTTNGLLLPLITGQPVAFDRERFAQDLISAHRESMTNYGCSHNSSDDTNVWISQNLWRDHTARYLDVSLRDATFNYWDMLLMSNTGGNSFGFIDTYIGNELAFSPRGATAMGFFLAGPRIVIDRLDGTYISINPDRHRTQRWPLLPLADWNSRLCPVCVVNSKGHVHIEGEIEEVKILGSLDTDEHGHVIG